MCKHIWFHICWMNDGALNQCRTCGKLETRFTWGVKGWVK